MLGSRALLIAVGRERDGAAGRLRLFRPAELCRSYPASGASASAPVAPSSSPATTSDNAPCVAFLAAHENAPGSTPGACGSERLGRRPAQARLRRRITPTPPIAARASVEGSGTQEKP